jgi:toxin-antitoxin system PIN domain toxin
VVVLLDVNVLVALAWPNHIHHELAHLWFEKNHANGWATCPLTQSGFVRVSSNRGITPEAKTPAEALVLLKRITEVEGHVFWMDDVDLTRSEMIATDRIQGYRQVTDAHLVALAIRHRGRLATFDRGIAGVVPVSTNIAELLVFLTR